MNGRTQNKGKLMRRILATVMMTILLTANLFLSSSIPLFSSGAAKADGVISNEWVANAIDSRKPPFQSQIYSSGSGLCNVAAMTQLLNRRLAADNKQSTGWFTPIHTINGTGAKYISDYWGKDGKHYYSYSGKNGTGCWDTGKYSNGSVTYKAERIPLDKLGSAAKVAEQLRQHPEGIVLRISGHVVCFYKFTYKDGKYQFYVDDGVKKGGHPGNHVKLQDAWIWGTYLHNDNWYSKINMACYLSGQAAIARVDDAFTERTTIKVQKGARAYNEPNLLSESKELVAGQGLIFAGTVTRNMVKWYLADNGGFIPESMLDLSTKKVAPTRNSGKNQGNISIQFRLTSGLVTYLKEEPYSTSADTLPISILDTLQGKAIHLNDDGEYWVKLDNGYYIRANMISPGGDSSAEDVTIDGYVAPNGNLKQGSSFDIKGTVKSPYTITKVTGGVYTPTGAHGISLKTTVEKTVDVNGTSLNLYTSNINVASRGGINFGTIPAGTYVFAIKVEYDKMVWQKTQSATEKPYIKEHLTVVPKGYTPFTVGSGKNTEALLAQIAQQVAATAITLSNNTAHLMVNDTLSLKPTITPALASDIPISWSTSDASVAIVSRGLVTAVGKGTATIMARTEDGSNKTATCTVTVGTLPASITISGAKDLYLNDNNNKTVQLTASVSPSDADDTSVTWSSSDTSVATVSTSGLVTAKKAGSAVIVAKANGNASVVAQATIRVRNWVSGITLNSDERIAVGATKEITATIAPENADNRNLTWQSSNSTIASVSGNGQVTGKKAGTVTITATAADRGTVKAQKTITVYQPIKDINISGEHELIVGGKTKLTVNVLPADADVSTMIWRSGDTQTATVDQNGNVTAAGNGTADIIATSKDDASVQAVHQIRVRTLISEISLETIDEIPVGTRGQAEATISPATASKQELRWESEDPDIAAVDGNGQVTGISTGTTVITAYAMDGSGVSASTPVMVYKRVQRISINAEPVAHTGTEIKPEILIYPEDAKNTLTELTTSDENVVRIEASDAGENAWSHLVCVSPGIAKITATSMDGSNVSGSIYITVKSNTELMNHEMTYDLLTTGAAKGDLDSIALTTESAALAAEGGHGATWTIEHISGDNAAEIGITEQTYTFRGFPITNAVKMKLLGINNTGSDVYRVTCTINGYSDSCDVTVNVTAPQTPLPQTVGLNQKTYQGKVGEAVIVNTEPLCSPDTSALPEQTGRSISGDALFSRFATVTTAENGYSIELARAGSYTAQVKYTGANYEYSVPITFTITNPYGEVPPAIEEISFDESTQYLLAGETKQLAARIIPAEADESNISWASSDTTVATVNASGIVTAMAKGSTLITASAGNNVSAIAVIRVTDSLLSIDWSENDPIRVYVEGEKNVGVQKVFLTARASATLTEAPEWSLVRKEGRNLTLAARPVTTTTGDGQTLYGCEMILKSASSTGTTTYELTCSDGVNSTAVTLTAEAMHAKDALPEIVTWPTRVFNGRVNQIIKITPVAEYWPGAVGMPMEAIISIEGDDYWNEALNLNDYTVSRNKMTFSFAAAGVYKAQVIYSCSNMRYTVPVEMRIADENGNVPVRAEKLTLSSGEISIRSGASEQIKALFAPADATNKSVTWSSEDSSIATVDANGLVTGVQLGRTRILCQPADENCPAAICEVVVENEFTVTAYPQMNEQYLQGHTGEAAAGFSLSKGTMKRLEKTGIRPEWTLTRKSGQAAEVSLKEREGVQYIEVTKLNAAGTDVYQVTCTAGSDYTWSGEATLTVIDAAVPTTVTLAADTEYEAEIGDEITLDFSPLCEPAGTSIPTTMREQYVGIGNFYNALEDGYKTSVLTEHGDQVTVAFKKRGTYILSRKYQDRNLTYVTQRTVNVGSESKNLLSCDNPETVVYVGGQSAIAATCVVKDTSIPELYGKEMTWKAERLSGDCLTVVLKADQNSASLYVVNAKEEGSERWRVSCSFAGITDYIDVTIDAVQPENDLPTGATLYQQSFEGMMGQEIKVPLAVTCEPAGAVLPSRSATAWTFTTDGNGEDHAEWRFAENEMKIVFSESGYYGGKLVYNAGNVKFSFPITFAVTDEEGTLLDPSRMNVNLSRDAVTVYPEGETNIGIVNAVLSDSLDEYSLESVGAFAEQKNAEWTLTIKSGNACTLALGDVSASAKQILLQSVNGTGDVSYEIKCTAARKTFTAQGTVHVAGADEERPQAELDKTYYVTPTGTTLVIDASLYDKGNGLKLCSGWDNVWGNSEALAAIGFNYEKDGDNWLPIFYEPGSYRTTVSGLIGNLRFTDELVIAAYTEKILPANPGILTFPAALSSIEDEAFMKVNANVIDLRGTNIRSIGANAFAQADGLMIVYLPNSVKTIDDSAFSGNKDFVIICESGSDADGWAKRVGYPVLPVLQ